MFPNSNSEYCIRYWMAIVPGRRDGWVFALGLAAEDVLGKAAVSERVCEAVNREQRTLCEEFKIPIVAFGIS